MKKLKAKITGLMVGATMVGGVVATNPDCILSDVKLEDKTQQICLSEKEYDLKLNEVEPILNGGNLVFESSSDLREFIMILNEENKRGNIKVDKDKKIKLKKK